MKSFSFGELNASVMKPLRKNKRAGADGIIWSAVYDLAEGKNLQSRRQSLLKTIYAG